MTTDTARKAALDRIDRTERNFKLAFFLGAIVEVGFIGSFLLLSDLANRSHLLLFLSSVAVYTIVVLGLFALGAFMKKNTLLILQGLETLRS
jgi:hypothetical protein